MMRLSKILENETGEVAIQPFSAKCGDGVDGAHRVGIMRVGIIGIMVTVHSIDVLPSRA